MNPRYELDNAQELSLALNDLRGFWKFWSACLLNSCGLPTLRGMIITRPYPEIRGELHRFLHDTESKAALIRHDKRLESPPHPRGGFLVGEKMLLETIEFFFKLGRIVAVYEEADPLLNAHNMNLLFENDSEVCVEVVGPGFDASDLQRGDLTPHETFSIYLSPKGEIKDLKLVSRIDQNTYEESVKLRIDKIRIKLDSSPLPEVARKIRENLKIPEDLNAYLRTIDSPLCKSRSYQPVPEKLLRDSVAKIIDSQVIKLYLSSTGARFPLVFSTSMVNRGSKQVFWDIVSPALKFEGLH